MVRSHLQLLPPELKVLILNRVDITSLPALITTCREFYNVYCRHRSSILYNITANTLSNAFPLAIALYAANLADWRAKWPLPSTKELMENVHSFGRKYLNRTTKVLPIDKGNFSLPMALEMITFHQIVEEWTSKYIDWSMDVAYPDYEKRSKAAPPSATETTRVHGAFYAIQIVRELLPFEIVQEGQKDRPWDMLWHYFAPWENRLATDIDRFIAEVIAEKFPDTEDLNNHEAYDLIPVGSSLSQIWLSKYGFQGLTRLNDANYMLLSFTDLADDCLERHFRIWRYYTNELGTSWLRPIGKNIMLRSMDIDHILSRFPQEETGPRDSWYFVLTDEALPDKQYLDSVHRICEGSTFWWDLSRFNFAFPGMLPSMEEMRDSTQHTEYDVSAYTLDDEADYCREIGY